MRPWTGFCLRRRPGLRCDVPSRPVSRPTQPPLPGPNDQRAPAPLVVAASLTGLEALLVVLFGLAELRFLSANRAAMGITTSMFFVFYGVALGYFAYKLRNLEAWARAPIVLAQLIQICVAWSFRGGATTFVAAALAVLAALTLIAVFHPASLRALEHEEA
jgi:hypothetical protein